MTTAAVRRPRGSGWVTLDLATLAFIVRLAMVVYALAEPVWDGHYYDVGARRIAAGHGYSEDLIIAGPGGIERTVWSAWAHYPVGYSGFLALFFRIFGASLAIAPIANALTGAALVAVVHRLALHVFRAHGPIGSNTPLPLDRSTPHLRALIAALIVALHPGLVLYSGALMTEPLAALGMLAAVLAVVSDRNAWRGAAIAAVLLGLTTLVRPNALLLAPFLPFFAPKSRQPIAMIARLGKLAARGVIVATLTIATVMPWTLRNCRVMDECALVSTNAGWNLVIGAAPGATGKFEFLVGHTPEGAPACDEGGQVAQDRCWWRYGVHIIERDFPRWLSLIPAKLHFTFDAEWFPINYLREARPDLVSSEAHIAWGRVLTAMNHALIIAAALAALGRRGLRGEPLGKAVQLVLAGALIALAAYCLQLDSPIVWPLAVVACTLPFIPLPGSPRHNGAELGVVAIIFGTVITHAIFFGEDRYHLVATPAFAILAAGLGRLSEPERGRARPSEGERTKHFVA